MAPAASACCRTKALGFHVMTMAGTLSPCTRRHCRSATPSIPGSSPHGRAGEIGVWPPGGWPVRRWSRAFPRAASASPPRKGRLPSRQSAPQRLSRMAIKAGYIGGYTEEYSFKKSTLFQLDSGNCDSVSGHHTSQESIHIASFLLGRWACLVAGGVGARRSRLRVSPCQPRIVVGSHNAIPGHRQRARMPSSIRKT